MATAVRLARPFYHPELDPLQESTSQPASQRSLESSKGILWGLLMGGLLWMAILVAFILLLH